MSDRAIEGHNPADAEWTQGLLLAVIPAILTMTIIAVIPIIPKLLIEFGRTSGASVLVPMAVVLPVLGVAISSIGAGVLGERIGRRRLLEISTALFAVLAVAPFWLTSLPWILASRAATGLALGVMTTSALGLTGDYFAVSVRRRWLAIQGGVAAGAGVITSAIAGALGDVNWRLPFLLLGVGFPLLLALLLLPARQATTPKGQNRGEELERGASGQPPWAIVVAIFALGVSASLIIFPPAYALGLVFQEKRLGTTSLIGIATAILAAGQMVGALAVVSLGRVSAPWKMALAFALGGAGTMTISMSGHIPLIILGGAAVGIGQGMVGPTPVDLAARQDAGARPRAHRRLFFDDLLLCPVRGAFTGRMGRIEERQCIIQHGLLRGGRVADGRDHRRPLDPPTARDWLVIRARRGRSLDPLRRRLS